MSGPGVGFEYPPKEVSWVKRDVLLFANSIGCTADELHFVYELDPNFSVFPTYPIVLPFKETSQEVVDFYAAEKAAKIPGVPDFDSTRVVDGQRQIQFFKPIPPTSAGKKFEVRSKVLGVYDKGRPGSVVEIQQDLVDASNNEVYVRIVGSAFYVAQGNWGGPKGPATVNYPEPKDKKPDAVFELQTTPETALLYRLNGDYNPLHADPVPGKKMGFGGVIIHGLFSWNWAAHGLLKHLGGSNPANIKEYQARFASPVKPGDKLVASAWRTGEIKDGWEEIRFNVAVAGGKVALSNGRALMKRRCYDGALCTVRYSGEVAGTSGVWLGVEWDDPSRGKHDGQHKGVRYFTCKSKSPTAASFVRPTRAADPAQAFVPALKLKYASDANQDHGPGLTAKPIVISGKVAEEVGFDKIRRQQAQLNELKIVILDGARMAFAYADEDESREEPIGQICPKVTELDLSRNLFESFGPIVDICSELPLVRVLRVNGNRFLDVIEGPKLEAAGKEFQGVRELTLEENLLEWEEICHIASKFPALQILSASANQLSLLSPIPPVPFTSTLVSIDLEFNHFTSLTDIAPLTAITTLKNLHLKGNRISTPAPAPTSEPAPVFPSSVTYLDLSYNQVATWAFVDALPDSFPGLTSLRFAHNPIYDNPELDNTGQELSNKPTTSTTTENKGVTNTDEAYMLMVARLPNLKTLNFSTITVADRTNAEMYYLSRIARQLSAVPESMEKEVLTRHRRWVELCEIYGEPAIVRQQEVNPNFLEARLVTVHFSFVEQQGQGQGQETVNQKKVTTRIPKSFDIYRVKSMAGKLFGLPPLKLRLVWETGEWDPVAGFDEQDGDSSEDEELEAERERRDDEVSSVGAVSHSGRGGGRWVKREVELKDGPRQFGYCVDGLDVSVRVESR
ncbi:HotDog domain containing protein [Naviculisporaceae sp. PSN 640]